MTSSTGRDDPSLLRFILARLEEEQRVIITNTPLPYEYDLDQDFADRYVGRRALWERNELDRGLVSACVESMQRVQGPPRVPIPTGPPDETTVLGSRVLKALAARFSWHPDYEERWSPSDS